MKILTKIICSFIVVLFLGWIERKSELTAFIIGSIMFIVLLILCVLELLGVISF